MGACLFRLTESIVQFLQARADSDRPIFSPSIPGRGLDRPLHRITRGRRSPADCSSIPGEMSTRNPQSKNRRNRTLIAVRISITTPKAGSAALIGQISFASFRTPMETLNAETAPLRPLDCWDLACIVKGLSIWEKGWRARQGGTQKLSSMDGRQF